MGIAVIADIVGSRELDDRAAAQRAIDEALAVVAQDGPAAETPLHPIVGDELQGVYPGLDDALAALLLLRLALRDGVDLRFGIGIGDVGVIPSAAGDISEGSAWWAARAAIEHVERMQRRTAPTLRTRVEAAAGVEAPALAVVNAYLLARDELVGALSDRTRRLVLGRCRGLTQRELAASEGITQPAVSQSLTTAGASAIVEGYRMLRG